MIQRDMKFLQRYVRRPHGSFISELTVARILALENRLMVGCETARRCWGGRGAKVLYAAARVPDLGAPSSFKLSDIRSK